MVITISGPPFLKKTLIEKFVQKWPQYRFLPLKSPPSTYQLTSSEQLELHNQRIDHLIETCKTIEQRKDRFFIFESSVIDSLAHSGVFQALETKGYDAPFIEHLRQLAMPSYTFIDIIFVVLPPEEQIKQFLSEFHIGTYYFYNAIIKSYENNTQAIFPLNDSPAVIPLLGTTIQTLMKQLMDYVNPQGEAYDLSSSFLTEFF